MSGPTEETSDVFIAHAGEDKVTVARPLADALMSLGWTVWLDELKLTIGDSLSRRIDTALARTRFGVVVLSPAFFSKEWPQRELAGLAARELDTGAKVILPVWHNVDHHFIVQRSPVLADRLGAPTSAGLESVAKEVAMALEAPAGTSIYESSEAAEVDPAVGEELFAIPTTNEEQAQISREQPEWWEHRLYAGALVQGRLELEDKWQDNELRLASGPRREVNQDTVHEYIRRELGWMRRQVAAINRVFDPEVLERAFGPPGEPGDPVLIKRVARGVIQIYGLMLDWAASLRNTSAPEDYEDILELIARMVDGPVRQVRDFTQQVADEIARIPILLQEAEDAGATTDEPMAVRLTLNLSIEDAVEEELEAEFDRLRRLLGD